MAAFSSSDSWMMERRRSGRLALWTDFFRSNTSRFFLYSEASMMFFASTPSSSFTTVTFATLVDAVLIRITSQPYG